MWKARVFTLYPEIFPGPLSKGLYGKALQKKIWDLEVIDIRDSAEDKHKTVDDTPFGGGSGMLLKPNVLGKSLDSKLKKNERVFYLYDLPGYGFAKVSKSMQRNWQELMGSFFNFMPASTLLFNLQDARNPNQRSDQDFYDYLKVENLEVYLLFNKIDKLKKQKERAALNKLKPVLYDKYKKVKPTV